jgi:hypothetical protein
MDAGRVIGESRLMSPSLLPPVRGRQARIFTAAAALGLAACTSCSSLPASTVLVLEQGEKYEIYAINPSSASSGAAADTVFHGHDILGRAEVKDPAARRRINAIVNDGVSEGGTRAKCFNPRHAIHAVRGSRTTDVLICFQCSAILIIEGGEETYVETDNVRDRLDREFHALGVNPPPEN